MTTRTINITEGQLKRAAEKLDKATEYQDQVRYKAEMKCGGCGDVHKTPDYLTANELEERQHQFEARHHACSGQPTLPGVFGR